MFSVEAYQELYLPKIYKIINSKFVRHKIYTLINETCNEYKGKIINAIEGKIFLHFEL